MCENVCFPEVQNVGILGMCEFQIVSKKTEILQDEVTVGNY